MNQNKLYIRVNGVLLVSLIVIFSACKKYDTAFKESPDQRINAALKKYESALTGSAAGWNATIQTANGGIYHYHFRFNDSNRVKMYSDFNQQTAGTVGESSYRLKALQTPALLFDTYSYLHLLSDPDANVNGGTYGVGLASDFEFSLDSLAADSILLTGRVHGTKLTLIKATQQDFDAWQNGRWATTLAFENINKIQNYFKRLNIGGVNYEIRINTVTRTVTFTWIDGGGNSRQFTTSYYYNSSGVVFVTPFNTGTQTINGLEIVGWDANNSVLSIKIGGTATTITGATQPLKVDLSAPQRWWQTAVSAGGYWFSWNGFHVNGVEDAYGVNTLTSGTFTYYYLIYWPGVSTTNDFFGPAFLDAAQTYIDIFYGTQPRPNYTTDGRAVFVQVGDYGPPNFSPYPSSGAAAQTKTLLYNSSGYYFVQTSATSYDMVSATDAKAWITWELAQ
jgi:hypothetical protein